MTRRNNHYEAAFEAWLRRREVPCVAIDESHRSPLGRFALRALGDSSRADAEGAEGGSPLADSPSSSLKSVDFIVSPGGACSWLVDVKGRRFPSGESRYWVNWTTRDELLSLARWEELFGPRFAGAFVFAYHVLGECSPVPSGRLFAYRGVLYAFVAIRLEHYLSWSQPLSAKWDTVTIGARKFRELARPAGELFGIDSRLAESEATAITVRGA